MNDLPSEPGIYRITCSATGDCYVGQSYNVDRRCRNHLGMMINGTHPASRLQAAVNEYGHEAFTFDVLERCTQRKLYQREEAWIKKLKPLYNSSGNERSLKITARHDIRKLKLKLVDEAAELLRQWQAGRATDETRKRTADIVAQVENLNSRYAGEIVLEPAGIMRGQRVWNRPSELPVKASS